MISSYLFAKWSFHSICSNSLSFIQLIVAESDIDGLLHINHFQNHSHDFIVKAIFEDKNDFIANKVVLKSRHVLAIILFI